MSRVIERIEALERMTVSNGCSPAEAKVAADKAAALRKQHNIPRSSQRTAAGRGGNQQYDTIINVWNWAPVTIDDAARAQVALDWGHTVLIHDHAVNQRWVGRFVRQSQIEYGLVYGNIRLFPRRRTRYVFSGTLIN